MSYFSDQVFTNGRLATQNQAAPWATSMAIREGKIVSMNKREIAALTGPNTKVTDLQGQFVMPGLIDCHVHALWGARQELFEAFVGYEATLSDLAQGIAARVEATSVTQTITGGPWNIGHVNAIAKLGLTPRQWLDKISTQHAICIYDTTKHSMMANSLALDTAHIQDQVNGENKHLIELDQQGKANGLLHEEATASVRQFITYNLEQRLQAGRHMTQTLHRYGITAMKEPMAFVEDLATYQRLDQLGQLNLHVFSHIARSSPLNPQALSIDEMQNLRDTYRSPNHHPDGCKLFLDGVAPSRSAAFMDPYVPCCCVGEAADKYDADALLRMSPAQLAQQLTELDAAGFTVKMHAVGDRASNAGLDGIMAARQHQDSGIAHEIAHTTFVTDTDFPRFAQLNTVAEVSPKLWFPTAITSVQKELLGAARADRCHPIKTLLEHGAHITYGSDWPAAVPDADPWIGIAGMITRQHPTGLYPGHVGLEQGINLDQALAIFTRHGAKALRKEDSIGQLKVGFQADFIVLDQHLDQIEPNRIADTQVQQTYFAGKCVYDTQK